MQNRIVARGAAPAAACIGLMDGRLLARLYRFNARPKLSDSDGPSGAMRQWACRFFRDLVEFVSPNKGAS